MTAALKSKWRSHLLEIGKWALVIWLLLPIQTARQGPVDFVRVSAGVILFVIFSGKLLYDVVFFSRQHRAESSAGKDILSMIGMVIGVALMVLFLVLFVAFFLFDYLNEVRF